MFPSIQVLLRDVNRDAWRQFRARCVARGKNASEVLRAFIARAAKGEIDIEPQPPSGGRKDKDRHA